MTSSRAAMCGSEKTSCISLIGPAGISWSSSKLSNSSFRKLPILPLSIFISSPWH
jgi:hypothetical protein